MLGHILQRKMPVIKLLNTCSSIKIGDMILQKWQAVMSVEAPRWTPGHVATTCWPPAELPPWNKPWMTYSFILSSQIPPSRIKRFSHCRPAAFFPVTYHGWQRSAVQKTVCKEEDKGEKKSNKYSIISSVYYAKFGMKSLSHINMKVTYLFIKFSSVYIIMLIVFLILNVVGACQTH